MRLAARSMNISEHTARDYIKRARAKYEDLGRSAANRTELMFRAIEDGRLGLSDVKGDL